MIFGSCTAVGLMDLGVIMHLHFSTFRPEYQGFDYKDDEERPFVNKGVSAKKTPVSGLHEPLL